MAKREREQGVYIVPRSKARAVGQVLLAALHGPAPLAQLLSVVLDSLPHTDPVRERHCNVIICYDLPYLRYLQPPHDKLA